MYIKNILKTSVIYLNSRDKRSECLHFVHKNVKECLFIADL